MNPRARESRNNFPPSKQGRNERDISSEGKELEGRMGKKPILSVIGWSEDETKELIVMIGT